MEILEVMDCEENEIKLNPLFLFEEMGQDSNGNVIGRLQKKGVLLHEKKLRAAGLS